MKKLLIVAAICGAFTAISVGASTPAAAQSFSLGFDAGNVHMGYRDGYYDRYNRWHRWGSPHDARAFRMHYYDRWSDGYGYRTYRDRDWDDDGVPNRFDRFPNNPWRS
jgi:hypothetical protein